VARSLVAQISEVTVFGRSRGAGAARAKGRQG
jgi:hypothetical protein